MRTKLSVIIPLYNQERLVIEAIKSIPARKDIEIIVVDDNSTDQSYNEVQMFKMRDNRNIVLLFNDTNQGVGYTVNKGIDNANGEYITLLGSDDYFITQELNYCIDNYLNDKDIVYYDLRINDGTIFHLCEETKRGYCGSTKFIKRSFIGDLREPEIRRGEDYFFYQELLKKNPTELFTNRVVKHYNYPRKGSLSNPE